MKLSNVDGPEGIMATIPAGHRAVSVPITDVSGVSGLLQPGSRVDVLFTRPGSMAEAETSTILQNVKVLAVGRRHSTEPGGGSESFQDARGHAGGDARRSAEAGTGEERRQDQPHPAQSAGWQNNLDGSPVTTEVLDPMISARLARARRGRTTSGNRVPNLEDPKVWAELTGEQKYVEPEKAPPVK